MRVIERKSSVLPANDNTQISKVSETN